MKLHRALILSFLLADAAGAAQADLSGTYDCKGLDRHEGHYTATVTLTRVPEQSTRQYTAYDFRMEVPEYGTYLGHAAARGTEMAIHFALSDPASRDFGTGIATFSRSRAGKWTFSKYYYEPEFKGGNHGNEVCVQR